jgi:hypothetical protein
METGLHLFSALAEFNVPAPVTRLSRRRNDKVKSMRQLFQNDYRTREETALAVDFCRHSLQHSPTRYHAPKQAAACAQFRAASPSTRSKQEIASYRIIIHSPTTSLPPVLSTAGRSQPFFFTWRAHPKAGVASAPTPPLQMGTPGKWAVGAALANKRKASLLSRELAFLDASLSSALLCLLCFVFLCWTTLLCLAAPLICGDDLLLYNPLDG